MRTEEFMDWMINRGTMGKRPMGDAISRCRRIERDLDVDLDREYFKNHGREIINLLDYSEEDAAKGVPLPGKLIFCGSTTGIKNSMASLKVASKKYFLFCEETM